MIGKGKVVNLLTSFDIQRYIIVNNILITGVNGFVGLPLCDKLMETGSRVRGTVRKSEHSTKLPTRAEALIVETIDSNTDWRIALENIDAVIHVAARVHVLKDTADNPLAAFREINVEGTERLARMAAAAGVRRFVFISSVKVNGEGRDIPYTEQDKPAPEDPYGISKWEAEQILRKIEAETGLEVVILRPPLVYGPAVKANFLKLLDIVKKGVPLPFANIINRRSFIYLQNLVDSVIVCIDHPNAAGQTYLVGDGEDVSSPELVRRIATAFDRPPRLLPFPPSLMRLFGKLMGKSAAVDRLLGSLTVDSSKICHDLGWHPPYTMKQGLRETADWYIRNYR
jgi:nucleoside-diphosphate-sugar epimerase